MVNTSHCPACERKLAHVNAEDMEIHQGFSPKWRGISFVCPHCKVLLGIQFDPADTVRHVADRVLKSLPKR